jgi:hypothetical protein
MEQLSSATTTCIEVQAFDAQQQVAAHSIARDCQERFDEAKEKLALHRLNRVGQRALKSPSIGYQLKGICRWRYRWECVGGHANRLRRIRS